MPDNTKYLVVPIAIQSITNNGTIRVNLGTTYNYFGLYWGSVDNYNTVSFLRNGSTVASFTGSQATSPSAANGNQTADISNTYVNFFDLPVFDSFQLKSVGRAFEVDNIAVGNTGAPVPEPGTMMLLGTGLLGLAGYGRKRMKK